MASSKPTGGAGPKMKALGLDRASGICRALGLIGDSFNGIELAAKMREDGKLKNGAVIDYLADGGREIRPSAEEVDVAAFAFVKVAEVGLEAVKKSISMDSAKLKLNPGVAAKARSVSAKAWRAAAKVAQKAMKERVQKGINRDGTRDPVSPLYAEQRQKKYGIPPGVIFKATGQLLANLGGGSGSFKLIN